MLRCAESSPRRALARALSLVLMCVAFSSSCSVEGPTVQPMKRGIVATSGDRQNGTPGKPLGQSITVRVVDGDGNPVTNMRVQWIAEDGGLVEPPESITDSDGHAECRWTLGAAAGAHHLRATANGLDDVEFVAIATSVDNPHPGSVTALTIETPDGSGQTVHPDFVAMPPSWPGPHEYLLITPYPNGDANFENPSLYGRSSDVVWAAPNGVHNPIASPSSGYLSDPDALYVPEQNELWVYYRRVDTENTIRLIRSSDGVSFGAPTTVVHGANHTIVSPSVVRRAPGDWLMWSVNANAGCTAAKTTVELRRSSDGLTWSAPETVNLAQSGVSAWHLDVQWIPSRSEFWMLFNGKTPGDCTTPALYLATSADGKTWKTYPTPVLARGETEVFTDVVYRSTFAYDAVTDAVRIWYSGASYKGGEYVWRSAFQSRPRSELFAHVSTAASGALAALVARPGIPPLRDLP